MHPFLLLGIALANTEVLSFKYDPSLEVVSSVNISPLNTFQGEFEFNKGSKDSIQLGIANATAGNQYIARVSWPANCPADLQIDYKGGKIVVSGSKENIVPLKLISSKVPFNVHLSPTVLGVPVDVVPIIQSISVVVAIAVVFAYLLNKHVF